MKDILVFDLDGVIIDSLDLLVESFNEAAEAYETETIKPNETSVLRTHTIKEILEIKKVTRYQGLTFMHRVKKILSSKIKNGKLRHGIIDLLKALEENYDLYALTGYDEDVMSDFFTKNKENKELRSLFKKVFAFKNYLVKGNALKSMVKELGGNKSKITFISDEVRDYQFCKDIGIRCINVGWGINDPVYTYDQGQSLIAETPNELKELIEGSSV